MHSGFKKPLMGALVLASLAACAGRGSDWPSLMTADERRTGKAAIAAPPAPAPATAPAEPAAPPPPPQPVVVDTAAAALVRAQIARLSEARRDAEYISARWQKQRLVLAESLKAIKSKGPADSNWNKAQLELTRLNQIAAEWDDLTTVLNGVAGQLAVGAHGGAVIAAPLAETGALLAQTSAAKQAADVELETEKRKISR
jgi:hypothetical protein